MKSDGTDIELEEWCRFILRREVDLLEAQLESAYEEISAIEDL